MAESITSPNPPAKRPWRFKPVQAVIGILLLLLVIGAGVYLSSPQFENLVRQKVIAQLEQITGGRVEIKSLHWNLSKLDIEIDDLTIHGLEAANEVPYAHFDHMSIRAKIISLFQKKIGLRYLAITRPVIHLIVYPNGATNQPTPRTQSNSKTDPVQEVFDLAVDQARLSNGMLLWNDRKLPFDIGVNQLAASLTFSPNSDPNLRQYNADIKVGELSADFKGSRPILSNAEAQLALRPNAADIKALRWSSARSRFEASGTLVNLKDPQIALDYRATFDAVEAASLLKLPALRGGNLDLNGSAKYHGSEYTAAGDIGVHHLTYRDKSIDLADVNATARFALDPRRVTLDRLETALFGGRITGNAEVVDWSNAKKQRGRAKIALAGLPLERALDAVSTSSTLRRVHIDSSASGTIDASWLGSLSNADAVVALKLAPGGNTPPSAIPLTGVVNATYSGRASSLSLSQLDLHTRGTQLSAQGSLGLAARNNNANLQFTVATQDLNEFTPVLAAFDIQKPPVALHGAAHLNGTATGTLADPHVLAHLAVTNFDTILPATTNSAPGVVNASQTSAPAAATKTVHFDSLNTDLDYTPDAAAVHNGTLRRGNAVIHFDAGATLRHRSGNTFIAYPAKEIPFQARVNMQNASLEDIQSLAGFNYPITGALQLSLNVSGTQTDLHGTGNVQVNHGVAYGNPFRTLQADVRFAGNDVQITRLYFNQLTATVNGTAAYNLATKTFAADLEGSGFKLSQIKQVQSAKISAAADAKFNLHASGTAAAPVLNAHLELDNLSANGEKIGNLTLDAVTHGDTLHLTGRTSYQTATLDLDGDVRLRGDYPGDLKLTFANFDIDPVIQMLAPQSALAGHSNIGGQIDASGPLKTPKLLAVNANIPNFHIAINKGNDKFNIDSQGPIRFSMRDQVARIDQFHLVAADTDISASGTAAFGGTREINAALKGSINLKLLQTFDPAVTSYGRTTIDVTARGTIDKPAFRGEIDLQNAAVSLIDLPNGLSNMNGRLVFNENRLVVRQFTAHTGGGDLNLGGFVAYQNGIYFDLTATGRDIRVRYPEGVSSNADADLHLLGTLKGATLSGDITITKFAMTPSFDVALYIARSKQPPSTPDPNSILNKIRLTVHVSSAPELAVQTTVATLSGDVDVDVRGTALNPIILGRVSIAEGDIFFNGTRYHLNRGDVTFTNPVRIDPVLNVEASATIRDYDITLGFHGPLDHLSTTYRSEPPLPSTDIISLLAFQRTSEQSATTQTSFSETAQNAVLGQALNAAVSSRVQKLLGFSKVKIDPTGGGLEQNQPSITVEQQVAKKLTITFITFPTLANQQVIQVEYNVNPNVSIVGIRDQYGVLGVDVRLRQRKR